MTGEVVYMEKAKKLKRKSSKWGAVG